MANLQRSVLFCQRQMHVCLSSLLLSHVMVGSVMPRPRAALECIRNGARALVLEPGQVYVDDCRSAHTLEHSTPQEDSNMWIVNW
jgi:hypothetical protein